MTNNIKIISVAEFLKKNNNKKQNQEEVWNNISDLWNEYRKEPFDAVKNFLEKASSDSKKSENSKIAKENIRIIDLGCGGGRNMIALKDIEYYGVDFSANQIKAAEKLVKEKKINAKLFKINAFELDKKVFENEMFDYGLCIAVLHCIDNEKKRLDTLKEFYRVLKKGSEGLISVWNSSDKRFNGMLGDIYMSWKKDGTEYYRYYYLFSKEEFLDLLKSVGFKVIEINNNVSDRFSKKNLIVRVGK